ncbi:MAG: aconitate hydratase [Peptoniphilaceae bacterium]|nr:aconitate hydratase [Peptoniphilaceae bacterium]MDD7383666.1 aconitate hydratase [Peptoniphilaceae bacterium]MDY3737837.1 aconitate hydratase [Peptoniphilaceae bacterium]
MGKSLTYKIIENHLLSGNLKAGSPITLKVNQTLTQDSTGTMVYLELMAMDIDKVKTDLSVAYIDHNMLQSGFENADDHEFIKTSANKYGIIFSKPGGGICHQVHLEKFSKPGIVLIGSDSHTPTSGAMAALAIGAGGVDVAVAMANGYYNLNMPKVYNVVLSGKLKNGCNGKDVILEILKRLSVKGGTGYVMEYSGDGIKNLSVTDRATICNMGAELGATSSIFPSDENTKEYLKRQGREEDFLPLCADFDAHYDEVIHIDLDKLNPLVAKPHLPDNVADVSEIKGLKVDQICIGSCTNSSYSDMMKVAKILDGKKVNENVSLTISPGSANILRILSENGALSKMIASGARILESGCGPCIGMGQSPKSNAVSLRTFNRNFKGRSGTMNADVYLVSPEVAAFSAINGYVTEPDKNFNLTIKEPDSYGKTDSYLVYPDGKNNEIVMGPNIKPYPVGKELSEKIEKKVVFKAGDNITTDDICPSNAKLLPLRSNIPELSKYAFTTKIDDFKQRCEKNNGGIIVAGENYGQGSSREHAALLPLYLGIKVVIAKSFARIHKQNLINSGIIPLTFKNEDDYDKINEFDTLVLNNLLEGVKNSEELTLYNESKNENYTLLLNASQRDREILKVGGYLTYEKNQGGKNA